MKQRLCIRLPEAALELDTLLDWAVFSTTPTPETGTATVAEIGRRWGDKAAPEVTVIVPAADVLLTATRIPSRQLRQVKQALPYMVEELIAEPIEKVHLAIPTRLPEPGEELPVAVVSHQRLIAWLDMLYSQGLRLVELVPESLTVPWQPQTLSLLIDGERMLWRDGAFHGFQLAREQLPQLIDWLTTQPYPQPLPLLRIHSAAGQPTADPMAAQLREALNLEVDQQQHPQPLWPILAAHQQHAPELTINLLQGGYKVQRERGEADAGWRAAAAAAIAGVLIYTALLFGTSSWFGWKAEQLQADSVQLYRDLFPDSGRVVSARRQMAAQLGGSGDSGLMPLLAAATRLGPAFRIEQLRYSAGRDELQLQLSADSVDQLETARRSLLDAGFQSELAGASETGTGTRGRLLIQGQ